LGIITLEYYLGNDLGNSTGDITWEVTIPQQLRPTNVSCCKIVLLEDKKQGNRSWPTFDSEPAKAP
jgi:hypothetical protein